MMSSSNVWTISKSKKNIMIKTDALFTPGPQKYDPNNVPKNIAPSWKFATSTRDIKTSKRKKDIPGPGEYETKPEVGNGVKFTFGLKTENKFEMSKLVQSPGPAKYEPNWKSTQINSSSFSIRLRPKTADESKEIKIGPGSYELRGKLDKPSYIFDKTPKDKYLATTINQFPAANKYSIRSDFGKTILYTFSKSLRDRNNKFITPGPGKYELKPIIGNDGPKITVAPIRPKTAKCGPEIRHPSVGQYELISTRPLTPSYKMGNAKKEPNPINKFTMTVPGPQKYNPMIIEKNMKPQWIFGKSLRDPIKKPAKTFVPGPGFYESHDKLGDSAPRYSFRPKSVVKDKIIKHPGPWNYNQNLSSIKEKTPSWRIGTEKRENIYKINNKSIGPGPGRYNTKSGYSGPFILFHQRIEGKKKKFETPGPGFYKIPCSFRDVPKYNSGGSFDENFRWV